MTTLAIALADEFADWETALLAATARAELGIAIVIATPGGMPVTSMGGLRVTPDAAVEDLDPARFDGLVLCGGLSWEKNAAQDFGGTIRAFAANGRLVAGICAATLSLARAGVLDDVAHTSNGLEFLQTAGSAYRGQARYRQTAAAVRDGMIVTAAGTAPISFTMEILAALGHGSAGLDEYSLMFAGEHRQPVTSPGSP